MIKRSLIDVFVAALFGAVISGSIAPLAEAQVRDTNEENVLGVHLVVALKGQVTLKRQGWGDYAVVKFGAIVRRGDLLRIEPSSHAIIVCSDLAVHELQVAGILGIPCSADKLPASLVYSGNLIHITRGNISTEFPVIVSPRRTKVLNRCPDKCPLLKWTQVPGLSTFTVSLHGPNLIWTKAVTSATEVSYPRDAPKLVGGSTYKLTVTGAGLTSDEDSEPGLGFTMLKDKEADAVLETEKQINNLPLPEEARELLTAYFYASKDINAEAIEQLERLATKLNEASVFRLLGDLYVKAGLYRFAESFYLQALQLSIPPGDLEGQALVQEALGSIYSQALGNEEEALRRLQKASTLYKRLGDLAASKKINEQLARLQEK